MEHEGLIQKTGNLIVIALAFFMVFNLSVYSVNASPAASFSYTFNVNADGATDVEIDFSSSDTSGSYWVVVPKDPIWNYTYSSTNVSFQHSTAPTTDVGLEELVFYQVFMFQYTSSSAFNLKVQFDFEDGALIVDDRGIFFSPQIGYKKVSQTTGTAEVLFDSHMTVASDKAVGTGNQPFYPNPSKTSSRRVFFDLPSDEDLMRLQIEFSTTLPLQSTTVESQSQIFSFETPNKYFDYATNILNVYDEIYNNFTELFHVTLTPPIEVQFFLPSFEELLTLGGFTPFSSLGAGTIHINVFFIRAVNGTIEVIAVHELVHHFLIEADISPSDFLWFHEGMAQYVSVAVVEQFGYEGATEEKTTLEQNSQQLKSYLGGEHFGFLQDWSPSSPPPEDIGNCYVAAYYVTSRLGEYYGGFDFYSEFFNLIHGVDVSNIDILTLYLSRAANASVALTLQAWGFGVADLFTSKDVSEKLIEAQKTVSAVNPFFQPYKFVAEQLYRQALESFKHGDDQGGMSLLNLAILIANLSGVLTMLTILILLGILAYLFYRSSRRRRLMPPQPAVPPPPPEIFPQPEQ
jgi:hypothetical protein